MRPRVLRLLNLVLAPMQIVAAVLAFGLGTSFEQATASPSGDPPIVPAEYAFGIWAVIYAGSVVYGLYQYGETRAEHPVLRQIRPYTASAFASTACWLIAARFHHTALTVGCILWLEASLLPAFVRSTQWQQTPSYLDRIAVSIPVSIYTGWVTVAVFANSAAFLHEYGLLDVVLTPVWWAVVMVIAAGAIAVRLTLRSRDVAFALTVCWALAGILVANLTRSVHPEVVLTCAVTIGAELLALGLSRRRSAPPARLFEALEEQRLAMVSLVQDWPADKLAICPAPGEWSVNEVFDHLVRVEEQITAAARAGLRSPHRIGLRDRLGFVFIDRVFRSRRRVNVPSSAAGVLPDSSATLAVVCGRWECTRSELARLLDGLTPDQLRAGVFRHPVSGWMTVPQILRFFSVHMHHHTFQLERLRQSCAPDLPTSIDPRPASLC